MSQAGIASVTKAVPSIPTQFTCDLGIAIPSGNNVNIFGAGGATTSASGSTITITAGGGSGFAWSVVTSASNPITFAASNGYITKGASAVHFNLPAAASIGDTYRIVGYGNLWSIAQNANQSITLGIQTSTVGVGGSISASGIKDSVTLVCVTANLEWIITDSIGNIIFI